MDDTPLVTPVVPGSESSMAIFTPKLDVDMLNALFARAFPAVGQSQTILVTSVEPGHIRMTGRYREGLLRPGGVISGPTLMSLADSAAYALVLAHIMELPFGLPAPAARLADCEPLRVCPALLHDDGLQPRRSKQCRGDTLGARHRRHGHFCL